MDASGWNKWRAMAYPQWVKLPGAAAPEPPLRCKWAVGWRAFASIFNFLNFEKKLFVHAGILPKHLSSNENSELNNNEIIVKMNTLMRLFLQGKKTVDDPQIQQYFLQQI